MISKATYERLYSVYRGMKSRCYSKKNKSYRLYGGRGIKVCDEWLNDKNKFIEWAIKNGYKKGLTIDRVDGDKGYNPINCRWVDRYVQNNNTNRNTFVTYKGKTHTLAEWARITGISYKAIFHRYSRKWSTERMLTQPQEKRRKLGEV